jgi:hypothetical protein
MAATSASRTRPYGRFTFVRVRYTPTPGGYWAGGLPSWVHGYPVAEQNLLRIMRELEWGDTNWRGSFLQVRRNLVRGQLTTPPKNHQRRRVDLSRQLRAELRLWRRRQRAAWLKHGQPFPAWMFPSVTGTAPDESNVRKAFNRMLDAAGLHRCGPQQMRHTFASLLLQKDAPITYVSRQLGHKDSSVTLRVYAHWVPDASTVRAVDLLDDTQPPATQTQPTTRPGEWRTPLSAYGRMVSRVGIVHVGEPEGRSRVAEAGPDSTNPNEMRGGEPNVRQLEPDSVLAESAGQSASRYVGRPRTLGLRVLFLRNSLGEWSSPFQALP